MTRDEAFKKMNQGIWITKPKWDVAYRNDLNNKRGEAIHFNSLNRYNASIYRKSSFPKDKDYITWQENKPNIRRILALVNCNGRVT